MDRGTAMIIITGPVVSTIKTHYNALEGLIRHRIPVLSLPSTRLVIDSSAIPARHPGVCLQTPAVSPVIRDRCPTPDLNETAAKGGSPPSFRRGLSQHLTLFILRKA